MKVRRLIKISILTAIPVLLAAYGYIYGVVYHAGKKAKSTVAAKGGQEVDRTYKVKRDNLTIGLRLSGNVTASKKHKLSLQANYRTKLLSVVEENAKVKEGDVLAVFETDEINDKIDELRTNLANQEKELVVARENAKVQESANEVELKAAEDRQNQAEAALRKYQRFERATTRNTIDLKISTAETNLLAANQEFDDQKAAIDDAGAIDQKTDKANQKKLRDLQTKIDSADNALTSAGNERKAFQRYDNPIKLLRLYNELEQSKLNRERVRVAAASNLVQKQKMVDNLSGNIRRLASQLEKNESYLPQMKLVAPTDGIIIYGDPDQRWNRLEVKVGMDVWKGLILLTIPEMNNLMVDFDLPEQSRSKTKVGDRVVITPDSIPTLKIEGQVSQIATIPGNQIFWDTSSPKVYNSRITLDAQNPQLVNGMSVQIEIVSKVLRDTLFVPVESVFETNSGFFVYVHRNGSPKEVPVTLGESNDSYVQILDGLKEGDIVYLYRPYQKKQETGS